MCVPLTKVVGQVAGAGAAFLPFLCRIKRSHFPGKCPPFMRNNWPLREGIVICDSDRGEEIERGQRRHSLDRPFSIDATPQSVNRFLPPTYFRRNEA